MAPPLRLRKLENPPFLPVTRFPANARILPELLLLELKHPLREAELPLLQREDLRL